MNRVRMFGEVERQYNVDPSEIENLGMFVSKRNIFGSSFCLQALFGRFSS